MAQLNLQNVTLAFGSEPLLDNVTLQIQEGEKISLLGRNGCGKSTMMRLINGSHEPDGGMLVHDKNMKTALLTQEVPADISGTIAAVLETGIKDDDSETHHSEQEKHRQVERILSLLTLDGDLNFETLSAGMKRRVLLGRALVNDPDILLLDEPTNHLDIESISWLEDFLARYQKTLFFVTHDRTFMKKIANRIIELDRGRLFDWKCDYQTFLKRKEAWLDSEESQNAEFDKRLAREETWIRKGIKARRTRNEGRVRALEQMRKERAERRERTGSARIGIQEAESSGKLVIEAKDLSFSYGDNNIIENFSTRILRGDKIGIIGPNGCGKSTLIKLLLEKLKADQGTIKLGTKIEEAYFDQLRDRLDEDRTVRQNVTDGNEIIEFNGGTKHVIGYLQDFLFTPDRADVKVEVLSGGEKNRLLLAKLFTRPANLLILDEPTNDLDIETMELLEELLVEYSGTLLLISHDRTFLNNVVTSTLVFEGNGQVNEYAGGYDDWLIQGNMEKEVKAKEEKRPKIKPKQAKTKLSFKEKKELEELPSLLEKKENRIEEIHQLLADPALYQEEGSRVAGLKEELETSEGELEILFARWEELDSMEASFTKKD